MLTQNETIARFITQFTEPFLISDNRSRAAPRQLSKQTLTVCKGAFISESAGKFFHCPKWVPKNLPGFV